VVVTVIKGVNVLNCIFYVILLIKRCSVKR